MANVFESQFQESCAVSFVLGRGNLEFEVAFLGIEEWQKLRIGQKDIYVMTLAVINLQHHCRAATERPMSDDGLLGICLTDNGASYPE